MRSLGLVVTFLLASPQIGSDLERSSLEGIKGFDVGVLQPHDKAVADQIGLTERQLKTDMEVKLRIAGLPLQEQEYELPQLRLGVTLSQRDGGEGLAQRRPALAAALTVLLISLTGVPVSAGFVGKFYVFSAAIGAGYAGLAILGVLMSVVFAYYYLAVVVAMYMRPSVGKQWGALAPASSLALATCVAVVLAVGIYPSPLLGWARAAAAGFR